MDRDEELDAILAMIGDDLDDAELDRRTTMFRAALRRLRDDPAEAKRIDALTGLAVRDDPTVVALVDRATRADPAAWNEIVERYAPLVWSICARFQLRDRDREDVAQNVWLLLLEQLGKLREPAALPGWLATTTHRECLRVVTAARKTERLGTALDDAPQFVDNTMIDEEILMAERNAVLWTALAELPPRCQQLVAMLISDPPYSYAEISTRLQIPVGSIGPQRARCLDRLRKSSALAGLRDDVPWAEGKTGRS
jgi:RNA polymerase sigma factor (sigma-70 family)